MCIYEYGVWTSINIYMHTVYIYWNIHTWIFKHHSIIYAGTCFRVFMFTYIYTFFVFAYRQRCVSQGSCGPTYWILKNLRLLRVADESVCWWRQISSNIVGNQQKWHVTFHLAQGINLMKPEHRVLQFCSMMLQKILPQWRVHDMWKALTWPCHRISLPCDRAFAQELVFGF